MKKAILCIALGLAVLSCQSEQHRKEKEERREERREEKREQRELKNEVKPLPKADETPKVQTPPPGPTGGLK